MESDPLATTYITNIRGLPTLPWSDCFHAYCVSILAGANFCAQGSQCYSSRDKKCLSLCKSDSRLTMMILWWQQQQKKQQQESTALFTWFAEWDVGSFKELRGGRQSDLSILFCPPSWFPSLYYISKHKSISPFFDRGQIMLTRLISILSFLCAC